MNENGSKQQRACFVSRRSDRELGLAELISKHAKVYGYQPDPITGEKALACLLSLGDEARDLALQVDDPAEQREEYRLAALAYKYAYLLRHAGTLPDLDLVGDAGGAAFAGIVEARVSRAIQ